MEIVIIGLVFALLIGLPVAVVLVVMTGKRK